MSGRAYPLDIMKLKNNLLDQRFFCNNFHLVQTAIETTKGEGRQRLGWCGTDTPTSWLGCITRAGMALPVARKQMPINMVSKSIGCSATTFASGLRLFPPPKLCIDNSDINEELAVQRHLKPQQPSLWSALFTAMALVPADDDKYDVLEIIG